jgi:hypothetical protein
MKKIFTGRAVLSKIDWVIAGMGIVAGAGIWARFHDLAAHFAHVDDIGVAKVILNSKMFGGSGVGAVTAFFSYAPAQFFITPFLINAEMDYREILFWGRLPSCGFGVLGVLLFGRHMYIKGEGRPGLFLLPLVIFTLSLEGVMFAHLMHNYALGMLAAVLLLIMLDDFLEKETVSWRYMAGLGLILGGLLWFQYTILFLIAAFYATLTVARPSTQTWKAWLARIAVCGSASVAAVIPLWYFFIQRQLERGHAAAPHWNRGGDNEFFFSWDPGGTVFQNLTYASGFFFRNFLLVFQNNIAPVPETGRAYVFLTMSGLCLFALGYFRSWTAGDRRARGYGVFATAALLVWAGVVAAGKLSLSPTRHHLILLPVTAGLIGYGAQWAVSLLKNWSESSRRAVILVFCFIWAGSFARHLPEFFEGRRDVFDEAEIIGALERYGVDTLMAGEFTHQQDLMKGVRKYFRVDPRETIPGYTNHALYTRGAGAHRRVAWLHQRADLTPALFEYDRKTINRNLHLINQYRARLGYRAQNFLTFPLETCRVLHRKGVSSDVSLEVTSRVNDGGTNSIYFYVMDCRPDFNNFLDRRN